MLSSAVHDACSSLCSSPQTALGPACCNHNPPGERLFCDWRRQSAHKDKKWLNIYPHILCAHTLLHVIVMGCRLCRLFCVIVSFASRFPPSFIYILKHLKINTVTSSGSQAAQVTSWQLRGTKSCDLSMKVFLPTTPTCLSFSPCLSQPHFISPLLNIVSIMT